jgi:hypothetical protein
MSHIGFSRQIHLPSSIHALVARYIDRDKADTGGRILASGNSNLINSRSFEMAENSIAINEEPVEEVS